MRPAVQESEGLLTSPAESASAAGDDTTAMGHAPSSRPGSSVSQGLVAKLVRRKRIEDILLENQEEHKAGQGLAKTLTLPDLVAYGIGSTVGAGLFVVTGKAARQLAGPAVSVSFVLAAFASLLSAFCYAEFATRVPVSGSAYSYAYVSFGEAVAWFIGWNLTLEYGVSASAVARGWADYFTAFLETAGVSPPTWLHNVEIHVPVDIRGSPLAALIIAACSYALLWGASESARLNLAITVLNCALILFIIVVGSSEVDPGNWHDFAPHGVDGIMSGAAFVFFSYIGFDCVCTLSEELRNPSRDLPIGIVGTLVTVSALYVAVSLVLTGMVEYSQISLFAPLSDAFVTAGMKWAGVIVAFGTSTILTSTTLCSLFGQPRVFFAMAKDGLIYKSFARLNPKTKVPEFSVYVCGTVSATLAFLFDIDALTGMISVGTLLAFTIVCLGILVIRYQNSKDVVKIRWLPVKNHSLCISVYFLACILLNVALSLGRETLGVAGLVPCGVATLLPVVALSLIRQNAPPAGRIGVGAADEDDAKDTAGVAKRKIFLCPLVPWVPCLGIFVNMHLILSLPYITLLRLLVWTVVGFAIYFSYGIRHSRMNTPVALYHAL